MGPWANLPLCIIKPHERVCERVLISHFSKDILVSWALYLACIYVPPNIEREHWILMTHIISARYPGLVIEIFVNVLRYECSLQKCVTNPWWQNNSMHNLASKSEVLTVQAELSIQPVPIPVPTVTRFQQFSRDIYSSILYAFLTCDSRNWIKCYIFKLYIAQRRRL